MRSRKSKKTVKSEVGSQKLDNVLLGFRKEWRVGGQDIFSYSPVESSLSSLP